MKSLDLNRAYYRDCVAPVLERHCPAVARRHAAALIGWGSEVLGNDDTWSKHYGWGPRVVLFLTPADHRQWAGLVFETLHQHIPPLFMGQPTRFTDPAVGPPQPTTDPDGWLQIPITTCQRFVELYLGLTGVDPATTPLAPRDWLLIPEAGLLRLTAGEVYYDGLGELDALRAYFRYLPDDVWRYKLAYQWMLLSWDIDLIGLCAARGDTLSARMAAAASVKAVVGLTFLLNQVYQPGYLKWVHRQFSKLPHLAHEIGPALEEAMAAADPGRAVELLYPVLDCLVAFQSRRLELPPVDYQRRSIHDRGFFAYDLSPVIDAIRDSIAGELSRISFPVGGVDQWTIDQDLLLAPGQLRPLREVYDGEHPTRVLFRRDRYDHFL